MTLRWTVVTAVVVFAVTGERLLTAAARNGAVEQARICALTLEATENDARHMAVSHLLKRYERLLAVGLLDDRGSVISVLPDSGRARAVIEEVSEQGVGVGPIKTAVHVGSVSFDAWGVRVPLAPAGIVRSPSPGVVFLFHRAPYLTSWIIATVVFGLLVSASVHLAIHWIGKWFDRRITAPLRQLATPWAEKNSLEEWVDSVRPGGWSETEQIAQNLRTLGSEVVQTKERVKRLIRTSQVEMKLREQSFDRRLRRVRDQAMIDPLTRLRNRRFLEEKLEQIFDNHRNNGSSLALVMLDLDNFKAHNDSLGHQAGDDLLRFVGELLNGAIRPDDIAVRYGGDEFVLFLPDTSSDQAKVVAERVVKLFAQYTSTLPGPKSVTMSAGVACTDTTPCESGLALLRKADEILYTAKSGGKNAVACV